MSAVDAELDAFLRELVARLEQRLVERLEERFRPRPTCLSYEEAATELGICTKTLGKMIRSGDIRTSTIRGRPKISWKEIERVSAPDEERPKVERRQRRDAWVPLKQKREKKPKPPEDPPEDP